MIGSGTCEVDEDEGRFDFKVALTDKNGQLAGSVFLCAELVTPAFQPRSSAGRMIAEVDMPPSPPPEEREQLNLAISPLTGVLAPEEIDNPNSPYYGILAL
ncbi:hypothetical protein H632_c753p1 [Helicosporidium sp. ATCC 50920]|nr:hypothetical protein H632_c753p1 [Helicosporidium sp. ATCC 50920]|eukprot:KDD75308.1 hypothetical protein H632_c753p1 [Helicosporidium sp. ATCC 50920]